jgi:membrane peptidoglycan carboxypeptidase
VVDRLAERYGRRIVERGGMKVTTSLDYDLQLQLNCAIRTQLLRLEGQPAAVADISENDPTGPTCESARLLPTLPPGVGAYPAGLAASGLLLDPQTGQVLALAGDTTLDGEKPVLSGHAPGSLLSPFVALSGFARGMAPAGLVWDIPASLPTNLAGRTNPDQKYHGPVRLRLAIANDYLVPLSQVLEQIGPVNVWRLAEPFGLNLLDGASEPSALLFEGGRVSPLAAARAYATFANLGTQIGELNLAGESVDPILVLQAESQAGAALYQAPDPTNRPVVSAQLAYLVHHVLSDESARWPSLGYPNPLEIGRPVGAKTGQITSGAGAGKPSSHVVVRRRAPGGRCTSTQRDAVRTVWSRKAMPRNAARYAAESARTAPRTRRPAREHSLQDSRHMAALRRGGCGCLSPRPTHRLDPDQLATGIRLVDTVR